MSIIWIGDFRSRSIQAFANAETEGSNNDTYILEDTAEYLWFKNNTIKKIESAITTESSIIFALGFNDCVNSCVWESLSIDTVVGSYIAELNKLALNYPQNNIYVCSVNPVDSEYACANYKSGFIEKSILDSKIKKFNKLLEARCTSSNIEFIDSYTYLNSTSFKTRDGVHFNKSTSEYLYTYIISHTTTALTYTASFKVIEQAPTRDNKHYYEDNPYWQSGYGMPNCTAYAWGRFYEVLGEPPKLSLWNAEYWYLKDGKHSEHNYENDGYERGQDPKPGAIICWQDGSIGGSGAGHVAFVESVNPDGSLLISEDGANIKWRLNTINKGSDGNWGYPSYKFQGFIYNPAVTAQNTITAIVDKTQVTSSNESLLKTVAGVDSWDPARWTTEIKLNARYIWQYFSNKEADKKWTLNAVAGMLGNMQTESYLNPGVWQSFREWGPADEHGYGLVQWTPYTKFTDWCTENGYDMYDIDTALLRIEKEVEANSTPGWSDLDQWISTSRYDMSFNDFTKSELSAYELGKAFVLNYERPGDQSESHLHKRGKQAESWYNYLSQFTAESVSVLTLENLKIDEIESTGLRASFITTSSKPYNYEIFNSENIQQDTGAAQIMVSEDKIKIAVIDSNKLIPNTKYNLKLKVVGNSKSDNIEKELAFTTLQAYPESATNIKLAIDTAKKLKSVGSSFIAEIVQPTNWGYWKKNNHGYELHFLVNGRSVVTKNIDVTNSYKFIPIEYKKDLSASDTIQIGIRTWVIDNDGNKIFDSDYPKTSNPICFLTKPILAYLNNT